MAGWTLVVSSRTHVDGWLGEAKRVRALLDAVSACLAKTGYGAPLTWWSEDATAEQWQDMNAVAAYMEADELRDDAGTVMKGGGSSSVVEGYLPGASESIVYARYVVGREGDWPFNCSLHFDDVPSLHEHSVEWLVELVNVVMMAVDGYHARIKTGKVTAAVMEARFGAKVSEVTLIPHQIDRAELPESVTMYPGPESNPDAVIVVANLPQAAQNPDSVVPDLLKVDDLIKESN